MMLLLEAVGIAAAVFGGMGALGGSAYGLATLSEKHPKLAIAMAVGFSFAAAVTLVYAALAGWLS